MTTETIKCVCALCHDSIEAQQNNPLLTSRELLGVVPVSVYSPSPTEYVHWLMYCYQQVVDGAQAELMSVLPDWNR